MVRIPSHPCAAALIDTNNSYACCSGTVDSGHNDLSRVRRDIEGHCVGVGRLAEVLFLLGSEVRNETKESPSNDRAIAPGTQLPLCCLVDQTVGRGNMKGLVKTGLVVFLAALRWL